MTAPRTWDETTRRWSDDDPKTDNEKHAFCRRRGKLCAVFLTQAVYDAAERRGIDMRYYVVQKPMPTVAEQAATVKTEHGEIIEHKLPTREEMRAAMLRKVNSGEGLGAFHIPAIKPGSYASGTISKPIEYSKLAPSVAARWSYCPGSLTRKGNPK